MIGETRGPLAGTSEEEVSSNCMDHLPVSLDDVLVTAELERRPTRSPDYAAEGRALAALAEAMADSPQTILQKLVETALDLCDADSAGISILEPGGTAGVFRWHAVAGRFCAFSPKSSCGCLLGSSIHSRHFAS